MTIEEILDEITELANDKEFVKKVEPDVMKPLKLEKWMTKRVLYSYVMYMVQNG